MKCGLCGTKVEHPGICTPCAILDREREHGAKLGLALESFPLRYRSAKWGSVALADRVPDLWRVMGEEPPAHLGDDPEALRVWRVKNGPCDGDGEPLTLTNYLQARIVVLHGETSAGKTSLASAFLRAIIDQAKPEGSQAMLERARRCRFVDARDIPPPRNVADGPSLAADARRASVLLLDDVGQEAGAGESFGSTDRSQAVADLLNYRDKNGLQTIVTTYNSEAEGVAGAAARWARYGAGVARRYFEADDGLVIELRRRR